MADSLGDLNLQIGGDLSPLEDAFAQIPSVAQTAAQNIDAALASIGDESTGATQGIATLSDALQNLWAGDNVSGAEQLDSAIQGVATASETAAPGLESLGAAAHDAGEAAHESESAFKEWADKGVEVLEKLGLMIGAFEALKESITAFATEQEFVVSMTALTHSAETAVTTLEDLKATALELPVALDSLLSAAQKMTALGVSLEAIPDLLRAAADAAAATGNSFDSVASGLERVMVTGQVMARSLVQMGLTWQQVADQMGVSVEDAQAAFKKGAQSAEEDVRILVDTIEQQYGGLSAKLADTIGGSFTILKNQLAELAAQFGELLAPLAGALLTVVSGTVAVLSDALKGLKDVLGEVGEKLLILGPLFSLLGLFAEDAAAKTARLAEENQILKDDMAAEETAATNLSNALARHGIVIAQAGMSADEWGRKLQAVYDELTAGNAALANAGVYYAAFNNLIKGLYPSLEAFQQAIKDHVASLKTAADSSIYDAIQAGHAKLQAAANASAKALEIATGMMHSGSMGMAEYQSYVDANTKAQAALGDVVVRATGATKAQNEAIKEAEQNTLAWNKALDAVAKLFNDSATGFGSMLSVAQRAATSMDEFRAAAIGANLALSPMEKMIQANDAAIASALTHWYALSDAQKQSVADLDAANNILKDMVPEAGLVADAMGILAGQMDKAKTGAQVLADVMATVWTAVNVPAAEHAEKIKEIVAGWELLGLTVKKVGTDTASLLDDMSRAIDKGTFSTLQIDDAWVKFADHAAKAGTLTQDVVSKMQAMGAPMQIVLDAQLKSLTAQEQIAQYTDMTGQSELRLAQAITQVQAQQFVLHTMTMANADAWKSAVQGVVTAWDSLSKGIADAIVSGQNFGQVFTNVLQQLAKTILESFIKDAMNQLAASILKNTDLLGGFIKTVDSTTSAVSKSMQGASQAMDDFSSTTQSTMQTASKAVSGAASSMVADFNLIASAIGAIASIFSAIELAHTNTLLGRIEESTRRMDITMEGAVVTQLIHLDALEDIKVEMFNIDSNTFNAMMILGDISVAVKGMEAAIAAGGFGGGGGGGTGGMTPQIADMLAQQAGLIDNLTTQLNDMQRQIGPGGNQPSFVILGGGGGGGNSVPGVGSGPVLPGGTFGAFQFAPVPVPLLPTGSTLTSTPGTGPTSVSSTPSGPPIVNVYLSAGVVAGAGGMRDLANMVGAQVVQQFRQSGMKNY